MAIPLLALGGCLVSTVTFAVLPPQASGGDPTLAQSACNAVTMTRDVETRCEMGPRLHLLPYDQDRAALLLGKSQSVETLDTCQTPYCYRVLGEVMRAHYLLTPSLRVNANAEYVFGMSVVDALTGESVGTRQSTADLSANLESAEDMVAALMKGLNLTDRPLPPRPLLASVTQEPQSPWDPTPRDVQHWQPQGTIVVSPGLAPGGVLRVAWDLRGHAATPTHLGIELVSPSGKLWCVSVDGIKPGSGTCLRGVPYKGEASGAVPDSEVGLRSVWLATNLRPDDPRWRVPVAVSANAGAWIMPPLVQDGRHRGYTGGPGGIIHVHLDCRDDATPVRVMSTAQVPGFYGPPRPPIPVFEGPCRSGEVGSWSVPLPTVGQWTVGVAALRKGGTWMDSNAVEFDVVQYGRSAEQAEH